MPRIPAFLNFSLRKSQEHTRYIHRTNRSFYTNMVHNDLSVVQDDVIFLQIDNMDKHDLRQLRSMQLSRIVKKKPDIKPKNSHMVGLFTTESAKSPTV